MPQKFPPSQHAVLHRNLSLSGQIIVAVKSDFYIGYGIMVNDINIISNSYVHTGYHRYQLYLI